MSSCHWPLGCDIAIVLTGPDGREVRRRYTVRSVRDDSLVLDAVLHGHGPGSAWAAGLQPGDPVTFFGPRGEIEVAEADWLLALTDESGLPAIAALAEALGDRPITVLAEIATTPSAIRCRRTPRFGGYRATAGRPARPSCWPGR